MHDFVAYRLKHRGIAKLSSTETLDSFMERMQRTAQDIKRDGINKHEKDKLSQQLQAMAQIAVKNDPNTTFLWAEAHLHKEVTNALRDAWKQRVTQCPNESKLLSNFYLDPDVCEVRRLPFLSFMISFPFSLEKPYISKDEETFYLLDNPVRKEKLFQNPMVASVAWKGAMRHALWHLQQIQKDPDVENTIKRLFGTDNTSQADDFASGRLHFFSSFFAKWSIELINPHDRKSGTTASGPILMEAVARKQKSTFTLLYCFRPNKNGQSDKQSIIDVLKDFTVICQGITAMMTVYGFGAKTSSGFGVSSSIMPDPGGRLAIRIPEGKNSDRSGSTVKVLSFRSFEEMNGLVSEAESVITTGGDDTTHE